MCERPI
jgi:hypothetical protein